MTSSARAARMLSHLSSSSTTIYNLLNSILKHGGMFLKNSNKSIWGGDIILLMHTPVTDMLMRRNSGFLVIRDRRTTFYPFRFQESED